MAILELVTSSVALSPATWIVSVLTFVVVYILLQCRRPPNLPPGPAALPLVGSLPFIDYKKFKTDINAEARRLSEKYGDVCSFYAGRKLVVILNSYESVREAFVNQGVSFAGRSGDVDPFMQACNPYHPVIGMTYSSYSPEWKKQRHLSVAILRALGWGKNAVEEQIQDECLLLVDNLRKNGTQPLNPKRTIGVSSSNIICGLLFGNRYSHDDLEFKKLLQLLDDYFGNRFLHSDKKHVPFLKYFSKSYSEGYKLLEQYSKGMYELSQKKMSEGRERLDAGQEPQDFIMHYLQELDKDGAGARISHDWLGPLIRDFFSAGTETTTTTLTWAMLYLAAHPDIQDKIHQELDAEFGLEQHRFSLGEKERLPYTEAFLAETQRLASIASFAIPHTTIRDVHFRGYTIPDKSVVLANLYSVSTDEKLWGKSALEFMPERFIDESGKLNKPDYWIPYSMGRRMCLGEQLAKQELFLFFSHMVHSFRVTSDPDSPLPSLEALPGAGVRSSQPFNVVFTPRF